jgi:tetratricopeptide (TPR) repeat protein
MDHESLATLQSIKLALYFLVATSIVSILLGGLRVWIASRREIRAALNEVFSNDATRLLAEGKLIEAVELCKKQLTTRPSDTYALWYLASAQFRLGAHEASKATLSKLVELEPGWDESHVQPLLSKMATAKISES